MAVTYLALRDPIFTTTVPLNSGVQSNELRETAPAHCDLTDSSKQPICEIPIAAEVQAYRSPSFQQTTWRRFEVDFPRSQTVKITSSSTVKMHTAKIVKVLLIGLVCYGTKGMIYQESINIEDMDNIFSEDYCKEGRDYHSVRDSGEPVIKSIHFLDSQQSTEAIESKYTDIDENHQ
ncbi:hypothetical protein J6590_053362 [Homalodisca vitripennis]|nr:hypothetical protein J6590_053362 [Homalodisca vitripennis]